MSRSFLRVFLFLLSIGIVAVLQAQNFENINVDELSDAQIRSFVQRAEESGYTEAQLETLAKARGMSSLQIQKLRERISKLDAGAPTVSQEINRLREQPEDVIEQGEDAFRQIIAPTPDSKSNIYGRSIFSNPKISFEPSYNIPTPENYLIGPGDELIIDIWGASEQNYQLTVSPEGSVRVPNLGPIYLNGLSIKSAREKVISRLKSIYSTLGQNTFAEVSLGQLKTIKVNIVGEVTAPGTYGLSSFSTVYTALYQAGGPSADGTLRSIKVYRDGKLLEEVDIYNFLFNAQASGQILRDQDVILIQPFETRITISGEVKRPMIYEMKDGETLADLIEYAGGYTKEAYRKNVTLKRINDVKREILTVSQSQYAETSLRNGDQIIVGAVMDEYENRITIEGAITREGEYELTSGMKLSDLITMAGGVEEDAFLERGVILRQNPDKTLKSISFSVLEVINGSWDLPLRPDDFVKIQSLFDLRDRYQVNVQGEVRSPGSIPFVDSLTVEDAIFLSGGFKEAAARSFVEVARRLESNSDNKQNVAKIYNFPIDASLNLSEKASAFKLLPYDLVVVRRSPTYEAQSIVEIDGQVNYPGKYALEKKEERISDLLKRAGGLTDFAYVQGATLIRQSEYFNTAEDEGNEAASVRRADLEDLLVADSLYSTDQQIFKRQESIGISLKEIMKNPGSKYDLILREGDVLNVPKQLQTVRIRGEVLYPSTVRYDDFKSFKQFIGEAGGFTEEALPKKAYVVYANGSAARTKRFLWMKDYPKIEPGAEIIVPKKPERDRLSAQEILGFSSAILSMVLVIDRLTN